jgi:hypothetical protein
MAFFYFCSSGTFFLCGEAVSDRVRVPPHGFTLLGRGLPIYRPLGDFIRVAVEFEFFLKKIVYFL